MRKNNQTSTILQPQANYQSYISSPYNFSSSQTNFYSGPSTPKTTILMNPFNQLYHSRNIPNIPNNIQNFQNMTPQKTHQMPMQTQSESKSIKSYNSRFTKEKLENNSNRWKNLLDDEKYLTNLECKMRVLLQENDKLLGLVDEKTNELKEYQELERKIHVILAENTRLNDLLLMREKENQGSLVVHQNEIIEKQNERIEQLINQCEELKIVEEENSVLKQRDDDFQAKIKELVHENEIFLKKLQEKDGENQRIFQEIREKDEKTKGYQKDLESLVTENEKFRQFFEEKQEENRRKLEILMVSNNNLNDLIEQLFKEKEKITEEKAIETSKKENFAQKLFNLLEINEQMNNFLHEEIKEKNHHSLIHSKIEELIETNQNLESAFIEKNEESQKYKALYFEARENLEGKDEKAIKFQTSIEEIEQLMMQIEILKKENDEIIQENTDLKQNQPNIAEYEASINNLMEENQKMKVKFIEQYEEKDKYYKELEARNEEITIELEKIIQLHQEAKNDLERILIEKEEISGNLHDKCMVLLDENNKLQQIVENKEIEITGYTAKIQEMEEEIEDKINTLKEYQVKNDNICQEFTILKEEFENHRQNSSNNAECERNLEENVGKLTKDLEILKTQNTHWKVMNETRDKEILKLYDLLKNRKQENTFVHKENQELKQELSRVLTTSKMNGNDSDNGNDHMIERDLERQNNEKLRVELEKMKEEYENTLISLEYYKGEYENSVKLIEEMKANN